jgi:ubiquinone/menaquinone biosynthesis C-methylase UbiE
MLACVDVDYRDGEAWAACLLFRAWTARCGPAQAEKTPSAITSPMPWWKFVGDRPKSRSGRPRHAVPDARRLEVLARAHDALAPTYDDTLAANPVAVWMRAQLWKHYARVFPLNARLLDFAAGTGADALYLARGGARVVALDISAGMIAELQRRANELGVHLDARVLSAENLDRLEIDKVDGALAGFAGLNTIDDLPRLSRNLARLLNPHGRVILHALNSFCLWETINRFLHGHLPRPRKQQTRIGGECVVHQFYDPFVLFREAFAAEFALREVYALSVIAAPTWIRRAPRVAPLILSLDRVVGRAWPTAGDFFVIDLERRGG